MIMITLRSKPFSLRMLTHDFWLSAFLKHHLKFMLLFKFIFSTIRF